LRKGQATLNEFTNQIVYDFMNQNPCYFLVFLSFFLLNCDNKSTTALDSAKHDSIIKYLHIASIDSLSIAERDRYNHKAFSLIDMSKNDTLTRWYLCESARYFVRTKNDKAYKKVGKIHFEKTDEVRDSLNLARYYRFRGAYHKSVSKLLDSSFYYYSKSEKVYVKINKPYELVQVYFNKGLIQYSIDDYLGANFTINQSYLIIKNKPDCIIKYEVLNFLANILHNLKDYQNAIKFHERALEVARKDKIKSNIYKFNFIATSYNNIGNSFREIKEYKKAIYYFEQALKEKDLLNKDPLIYAYLLNNIGFCKVRLKHFNNLPYLFNKSAKLFDSLSIKNECATSHVYLSDFYFQQKDTLKAIKHAEKSLLLARQAKAPYYYLTALSNAGYVNKAKAPFYIKEYHEINDSLQFEQRKVRNQFHKIELETNEIAQEKEKAIKQKWLMIAIVTGILLIVILLFVIHRQRARQKELELLQSQQKANEEIYQLMLNQQEKVEEARQIEKKKIGLELHDGIMNRLASTRLNLFVLSKKKDVETVNSCLPYIEGIQLIESEIRNLSHELNQDVFIKSDSFTSLLQELVVIQNNISTTHYKLQIATNVNWDKVSSEKKMHLYRIVQEAIHNSAKYAKATQVNVLFTIENSKLKLTVSDNGIGFDTQKNKEGIGLRNMEHRMKAVNGSIFITSAPNQGTMIKVTLPMVY
jgi:signal transduction histidine kinase